MKWIEFKVCRDRTACDKCRDRLGHRCWRAAVMEQFEVPAGGLDWECPHGLPWNDTEATVNDARWCDRFGLPTGPAACQTCTDTRASHEPALDPDSLPLSPWFIQSMSDLGRAYGLQQCQNRHNSGRTEPTRCCGGQIKDLPVYLCQLTGQRADCGHCRRRFDPQPITLQDAHTTHPPT